MGNWTTVKIEGTCDAGDVGALRRAVNIGHDWRKFHCLCNAGGICGLGDWAGATIDATGNLAERDFGADDIQEALHNLLEVAPSLSVRVHVGGDYEDKQCVATVVCEGGSVIVAPPQIESIQELSQEQMMTRLIGALWR